MSAKSSLPVQDDAQYHSAADAERACVVNVAAFADADPLTEGDRAFDNGQAGLERLIQEVSVEFQVDARVQHRQQPAQRVAPAKFIGGADVGHRAAPEVF